MLAAVIHNVSGNAKQAADLKTYAFKWSGEENDRTAFAALKTWATASNMQIKKGEKL